MNGNLGSYYLVSSSAIPQHSNCDKQPSIAGNLENVSQNQDETVKSRAVLPDGCVRVDICPMVFLARTARFRLFEFQERARASEMHLSNPS
eukprot:4436913-Amphidinium_carterae.1